MEIPELVREHLGDEELQTGIMLGDEDILCLTPTRLLLYSSEGLISDESVTEYPHEVERLQRSEGRRKTKFVFEYVEDTRTLNAPNGVADDVLELVLQGILRTERIFDDDESVVGAFRFSELTLVVGEQRVVKHVGSGVWEDDFEMFVYEDLTGLEFEKASVATEIVMEIQGRPQRIKTPNDKARLVEKTLQKAVFEFFGVTSMSELQSHFEAESDEEADDDDEATSDDFGFDSEIRPLGSESPSESEETDEETIVDAESEPIVDEAPAADAETEPSVDEEPTIAGDLTETASASIDSEREQPDPDALTREDLEEVSDQLSELTTAVNKQNELLRKQHAAIKQLVEELRQGR
jgi:hypothetical protein